MRVCVCLRKYVCVCEGVFLGNNSVQSIAQDLHYQEVISNIYFIKSVQPLGVNVFLLECNN